MTGEKSGPAIINIAAIMSPPMGSIINASGAGNVNEFLPYRIIATPNPRPNYPLGRGLPWRHKWEIESVLAMSVH